MKTTKTLTSRTLVVIPFIALGLCGCESEEARQHHLYNLQNCIAQTYKADETAFDTSSIENDKSMAEVVSMLSDPSYQQRNHDSRAADCMMHEEKTTLEYQLAKHDDYGKIKPSEHKLRAVDHNSHPERGGMQ